MDNHAGNRVMWLAGIIDGDGSIGLHCQPQRKRITYVPSISLTTSCQKTKNFLRQLFKNIGVGMHITERTPPNKKWNKVWVFETRGFKRVGKLLFIIQEYLITKFRDAEIVSEFIAYRQSVTRRTPYGAFEEDCRSRLMKLKSNRNIT